MHISRVDVERLVIEKEPTPSESATQCHLQGCEVCQAELVASLNEEELAGNPRINSNTAARIKMLDPLTSVGPAAPAHLLNASPQSLHVRVSRSMLIGTLVHVRSVLGHTFGRVRYCIPAGCEFQIGVKLEVAR
jgi:hypothetical protein